MRFDAPRRPSLIHERTERTAYFERRSKERPAGAGFAGPHGLPVASDLPASGTLPAFDDVSDGVDQREMGERLRIVAEVTPARCLELLGV
jgi:hypothetical protein